MSSFRLSSSRRERSTPSRRRRAVSLKAAQTGANSSAALRGLLIGGFVWAAGNMAADAPPRRIKK